MIQLCSLIIFVIILLILTGHIKRNDESSIEKKENYGEPPGMKKSISVSDYTNHPALIASPSKEWLEWNCGSDLKCKDTPDKYYGFPMAPLEFRGSTASSVSQFIERVA